MFALRVYKCEKDKHTNRTIAVGKLLVPKEANVGGETLQVYPADPEKTFYNFKAGVEQLCVYTKVEKEELTLVGKTNLVSDYVYFKAPSGVAFEVVIKIVHL